MGSTPTKAGQNSTKAGQSPAGNTPEKNYDEGKHYPPNALIYGNFSDLLIGLFSDAEILVDPYTLSQTGVTSVRILQAIDVKVRHAESFGAIQDITT